MTRNRVAMLGLAAMLLGAAPALADPLAKQVSGTVQAIDGSVVTLLTRSGSTVRIDASPALVAQRVALLVIGGPVSVVGTLDGAGMLQASAISRAKASPSLWPADH
jgi:hypothetical protein